jgi:hypothetical protein
MIIGKELPDVGRVDPAEVAEHAAVAQGLGWGERAHSSAAVTDKRLTQIYEVETSTAVLPAVPVTLGCIIPKTGTGRERAPVQAGEPAHAAAGQAGPDVVQRGQTHLRNNILGH